MNKNDTPREALERAAYEFGQTMAESPLGYTDDKYVHLIHDLKVAALRFYQDQQGAPLVRPQRRGCHKVRINTPDNRKLHGLTMLVDQTQNHYRGVVGTIPALYDIEGRLYYDLTWDEIEELP